MGYLSSVGSKRTFEDSYGGREVVDSAGSLEGSGHDADGGYEIVGEGVVKISLYDSQVGFC